VVETRPSHPNRWAILAVLCTSLLVVVIDVTVLHVAAPAISADLDPTAIQLLWIIDIYPLVAAPLLLASGVAGDRLGRKSLLLAGFAVFAVASLAAAFAPTAELLIAARALLGVGGAMILPPTMSIIRDVFRDRDERVRAVGIWSATSAGGAALGPLLGGFLVENWWWGSVFLINVPILLLVAPFAVRLIPVSRAEKPPPWDTPAVLLAAVGILGIAFGFKEGARYGFFEPAALVVTGVGVAAILLFVRGQLRRDHPILNVRLFARREFSVAVGCVFLAMFGLVGIEFFGAQYLQLVLDLEPLAAAVRLLPLMVATLVGALFAARLIKRFGTSRAIALGLLGTTVGLLPMLALGLSDQYILLWPSFILIGFALEIALVAANDTIISSVPADAAGGAAAVEQTAYELGGGFGVAILGSILAVGYSANIGPVEGVSSVGIDNARESLSRAVDVAQTMPTTMAEPLLAGARAAFMSGYHTMILVCVGILGAASLISAFLLRENRTEGADMPAGPFEPTQSSGVAHGKPAKRRGDRPAERRGDRPAARRDEWSAGRRGEWPAESRGERRAEQPAARPGRRPSRQ
jgi:DHA2 family multidrug resistance protein-like MFS transporter